MPKPRTPAQIKATKETARRVHAVQTGNAANLSFRQTRLLALQIAKDQKILPLEVMVEAMRYHWDRFKHLEKIEDVVLAEDADQVAILDAQRELHLQRAVMYASQAAPYLHAKLANVELTGKDGAPIKPPDVFISFGNPLDESQSSNSPGIPLSLPADAAQSVQGWPGEREITPDS